MRLAFFLLLSGAVLRADQPSELKTVLARFNGQEPIKAQVDFEFRRSSGEGKQPVIEEGTVTARVEASADGLRIFWSQEQIQLATRESQTPDANGHAAVRHAMDSLTATSLYDYLDATRELLRALDRAEFVAEQPDAWQGQPARKLVFKLNPQLSEKDRKSIRELDATAQIWVGSDGVPLAAESRIRIKGRVLLVISFESLEKEEFRFTRSGNRLVVTRHVRESSGSGGGESAQKKTTAHLTINENS